MYQLRPYQERALSELYAWLERHKKDNQNPIINACVGAGKSLLIAELCKRAISEYEGTRIVMLVSSQELCKQNMEKIREHWADAPVGLCSASLGKKDVESQIVFATIGSIVNHAHEIGNVDLILVDECHLVNPSNQGMYRQFIADCEKYNRTKIMVIGFTGTPFRGDGINIHDRKNKDRLFDGIATNVTMRELLGSKHLSPLVVPDDDTDRTLVDTSDFKKVAGDYVVSHIESAMNNDGVTRLAVQDIVKLGAERKKWLVFCVSVAHAENVLKHIKQHGINAEMITAKTPKKLRNKIVDDFKYGDLRCLVNIATLTTGFDAPKTDLIALLRPTESPVLYVQIAGRGMRIANGKENCLWLDYTQTTSKLGHVDAIKGRDSLEKLPFEEPLKLCPSCNNYIRALAKVCPECGFEFIFDEQESNISNRANMQQILSTQVVEPPPQWLDVVSVKYSKHIKKSNGNVSLKVDYKCIGNIGITVSEWVSIGGQSAFASQIANKWWLSRFTGSFDYNCIPDTVEDALSKTEFLAIPKRVFVVSEKGYYKVKNYEFEDVAKQA